MDPTTDAVPALEPATSTYPLLERSTTGVLLLFIISLAWMIAVAYVPSFCRLLPVEVEVILMLVPLVAAIGLVSLVALLHTR